jgi:hypothetical protein
MQAVAQISRCYPEPEKKEAGEKPVVCEGHEFCCSSAIAAEIARVGAGLHTGPMLFLDCETLTRIHEGQALRFGYFQLRGCPYDVRVREAKRGTLTREKLDAIMEEGLFYNPNIYSRTKNTEEFAQLKRFAKEHDIGLYKLDWFIKSVLFRCHWVKHAKDWRNFAA